MKNQISNLTLLTTEDCNFDCTYCFVKQRPIYLDFDLAKEALEFFIGSNILTKDAIIYFNGGEPLLNYDLIKSVVFFLTHQYSKPIYQFRYGISTNGSLITDEILDFLIKNNFMIEVSFDGLAQNLNRKENTYHSTIALIKKIRKHPDIHLMVNGVYPPNAIHHLAESLELILRLGVEKTNFSVCHSDIWNDKDIEKLKKEYHKVGDLVVDYYQKHKKIPVENYKKKTKGIWSCSAGSNQMTLLPNGDIWGCLVIYEYFKSHKDKYYQPEDFCFGNLKDFKNNYSTIYLKILSNHAFIRMDEFRTGKYGTEWCFKCENLKDCRICPIDSAEKTHQLGIISQLSCQLRKLSIQEFKKVHARIAKIK